MQKATSFLHLAHMDIVNPNHLPLARVSSLATLMAELLPQWRLHLPAGPAEETYTVHFGDDLDVHVVHRAKEKWVSVSCESSIVSPAADTRQLSALLVLNQHDNMDLGATVTLDPSSGTVVTWIRLPHAGLDSATLKLAIESVQRKALAVRQVLDDVGAKKVHTCIALRSRLHRQNFNQ